MTTRPEIAREDLRAVVEDPLTEAGMCAIAAIDRNCRLIEGQVFLWKDGQSWEDLWDMNGEITPPYSIFGKGGKGMDQSHD